MNPVCWHSIFQALRTAASAYNTSTVFIASDIFGRTSSTYSALIRQKHAVQEVVNHQIFDRGRGSRDEQDLSGPRQLKFKTFQIRSEEGLSSNRAKQFRAIVDLLLMTKSKLFVHMNGSFGRKSDALRGCSGAHAGSCYGGWVVHTRNSLRRPSRFLSDFSE